MRTAAKPQVITGREGVHVVACPDPSDHRPLRAKASFRLREVCRLRHFEVSSIAREDVNGVTRPFRKGTVIRKGVEAGRSCLSVCGQEGREPKGLGRLNGAQPRALWSSFDTAGVVHLFDRVSDNYAGNGGARGFALPQWRGR